MGARDWSSSATSNTTVGGIGIAPGMQRSDVDNAIRALMADMEPIIGGVPISPHEFGAVGDNVTDDTAAILAAIEEANDAGGGTVQLKAGLTYKTTASIIVKAGIRFNMNEAKIRAVFVGGSDAAVQIYSNSIVENGHVEVDSTGCNSPQAGAHAPIRVGNLTSEGGTVASPTAGENPSGWIIRNMIVESDKWIDGGNGDFVSAAGIQVYGGASNGIIEGITVPDNAYMTAAINMDWSHLGTLTSTATYANMNTNRTNFDAGTAYTTHPNNIVVRNVKVGALTADRQSGAVDIGSFGIRLSGCYNVTVENVSITSVSYIAFRHTSGDLGFEFAPAEIKAFACKNIVFRNCTVEDGSTAQLIYSDSYADNVAGASSTAVFTGAIAGSTLTVSAVASGTLAVGHKVYSASGTVLVGTISALGTGVGGTGTYTLTGAVTTSSTELNSGYGWLMDPIHETNILFDRVTAKGSGSASATYGIRIIQQRGGIVRDCDVSYYKNGINVDERVYGLRIAGCHIHSNREDGIYIHHATYKPEGVSVEDCYCHDNGQDSGFADPAGVHIGTSTRCRISGGRYGNASGTEATQKFGFRLGTGAVTASVILPEVLSYKTGGDVSYIQTTDHTLVLRDRYTLPAVTVAQLTTASSGLAGARATVSDSNAALTAGIGAVVVGGGANVVPCFCDGTNWRIG